MAQKRWLTAPLRPDRVWNRIADAKRAQIIDLALAEPELSPRGLATDQQRYFVSEVSVYRLLKAHELIASGLPPVEAVRR